MVERVTLPPIGIIHFFLESAKGIDKMPSSGDGGPASAAQLSLPGDIALGRAGNIYVVGERPVRRRIWRRLSVSTSRVIRPCAAASHTLLVVTACIYRMKFFAEHRFILSSYPLSYLCQSVDCESLRVLVGFTISQDLDD